LQVLKFDKEWSCEDEALAMVELAKERNKSVKGVGNWSAEQAQLNSEFMFFLFALIGSRLNETMKLEKLYERAYTELVGYASDKFAALIANSNYDLFKMLDPQEKIPSKGLGFLNKWIYQEDGSSCLGKSAKVIDAELEKLQNKYNFKSPQELTRFIKGRYIWEVIKDIKSEMKNYSSCYKPPTSGIIIIIIR